MTLSRRARLGVAVLALAGLGLGSAAQADPFVARLVGSVAGGLLVNGIVKSHTKKAYCRLYDREGMEVYLPCDPKRPLGELMVEGRATADDLAGGPDAPTEIAPPYVPDQAYAQRGDVGYAAPAPPYSPPPADIDCGCRDEGHGQAVPPPRPHHAYPLHQGGHAYSQSAGAAIRYSESYGYESGFAAGGGYAYGGMGYGGYFDDGRARVAGRDSAGFLTWPGKSVR